MYGRIEFMIEKLGEIKKIELDVKLNVKTYEAVKIPGWILYWLKKPIYPLL